MHPRRSSWLAIAVLVALAGTACHDVPPPTYCYQVTAATVHAVDTGMTVAGDLYRQGKISDAAKARLVAAHDVYRPLAKAAVDGCKAVGDQASADKQAADIRAAAAHVLEALVAAGVIR